MFKIDIDLSRFMDLQTNSLVTILGAAIYSWFQIRELRRSRDSTTAMNLAANFQSQDFVVGLTTILNMEFIFFEEAFWRGLAKSNGCSYNLGKYWSTCSSGGNGFPRFLEKEIMTINWKVVGNKETVIFTIM